jgi:hypothetical protein
MKPQATSRGTGHFRDSLVLRAMNVAFCQVLLGVARNQYGVDSDSLAGVLRAYNDDDNFVQLRTDIYGELLGRRRDKATQQTKPRAATHYASSRMPDALEAAESFRAPTRPHGRQWRVFPPKRMRVATDVNAHGQCAIAALQDA